MILKPLEVIQKNNELMDNQCSQSESLSPNSFQDVVKQLSCDRIDLGEQNYYQGEGIDGFQSFQTLDKQPDVVEQLFADIPSVDTRRAYAKDINDFFVFCMGRVAKCSDVLAFLQLEQSQAIMVVLGFKEYLMNSRSLSLSTVNRKLAAIKSMVTVGQKLGVCCFSLNNVKGEKIQRYRDSSGVEAQDYAKILQLIDRDTLKGKRDYAILCLLWDNALRRNELCSLNVEDFNPQTKTLQIKGTQKVTIELDQKTAEALTDWITLSYKTHNLSSPLFSSMAHRKGNKEDRLNCDSVSRLVDGLFKKAGVTQKISLRRIRQSSYYSRFRPK